VARGLSYLLDTNVILELLLDQDKADEAEAFLRRVPTDQLFLSDFSVHSLGVILLRRNLENIFEQVVLDDLIASGVGVVGLPTGELPLVVQAAKRFRLDFDDAYQYTVAAKHTLQLVSFDNDFDRTDRERITPA
jgi:predicted nucleic acid-binding protein